MATKNAKAKIGYVDANGADVDIASGKVATIEFRFVDGLPVQRIDLAAVPAGVANTAMVRGLAEKVRDEYAGTDTPDDALDEAKGMIERLMGDEWYGAREGGGPSISLFVLAVQAVKTKAGFPFDEAATREKYVGKDKTKARNAALAGNSDLRVMYAKLNAEAAAAKAQRTAERAAKAAQEASSAPTTGDASTI